MRRPALMSLAVLALVAGSVPARGDLIAFNDRTAFDAASDGRTVIDFSGLAQPGSFASFGNPGTLAVGDVTFATPNGPLFVQNDGTSSRLTFQQGTPDDRLDVTLPAGTTALGFDYIAGATVAITFGAGDQLDLGASPYPDYSFAGFTSDRPIASITLESAGGVDLMNFTFGRRRDACRISVAGVPALLSRSAGLDI